MEMSISGLGVNMKKQYGREIVAAICQADAFLPRVQVRQGCWPGGALAGNTCACLASGRACKGS